MRFEDEEDWFYRQTFTKSRTVERSTITIYEDRNKMVENFYALCKLEVAAQNQVEDFLWGKSRCDNRSAVSVVIDELPEDTRASDINAARICNKWDINGWTFIAT